jgi:hypothetical protein
MNNIHKQEATYWRKENVHVKWVNDFNKFTCDWQKLHKDKRWWNVSLKVKLFYISIILLSIITHKSKIRMNTDFGGKTGKQEVRMKMAWTSRGLCSAEPLGSTTRELVIARYWIAFCNWMSIPRPPIQTLYMSLFCGKETKWLSFMLFQNCYPQIYT